MRGSHGLAAAAFTLGLGAMVFGRMRLAAPLAALYFAINLRFYGLMLRRAGLPSAVAAVALLDGAQRGRARSAPLGVMAFATDRVRRAGPRATRLVLHGPPAAAEQPSAAREPRRPRWRGMPSPEVAGRSPEWNDPP